MLFIHSYLGLHIKIIYSELLIRPNENGLYIRLKAGCLIIEGVKSIFGRKETKIHAYILKI